MEDDSDEVDKMEDIEHTLTNCAHKLDMATVVAHVSNNESDSEGCSSASSSSSGMFHGQFTLEDERVCYEINLILGIEGGERGRICSLH